MKKSRFKKETLRPKKQESTPESRARFEAEKAKWKEKHGDRTAADVEESKRKRAHARAEYKRKESERIAKARAEWKAKSKYRDARRKAERKQQAEAAEKAREVEQEYWKAQGRAEVAGEYGFQEEADFDLTIVKRILAYINAWSKHIEDEDWIEANISPEAMRFVAARTRILVAQFVELAEAWERRGETEHTRR